MTVKIEMDMPKGCATCPLCELVSYKQLPMVIICPITQKKVNLDIYEKKRRKDCPLKECE